MMRAAKGAALRRATIAAPIRFDRSLFRVQGTARLRAAAARILGRALEAADPYAATRRHLRLAGDRLLVAGRPFSIPRGARVVVVGVGKAGAPMARAVEDVLGSRITSGVVTVKRGYTLPLRRIALREAAHPVPDAAGEAAAREMMDAVRDLRPRDLVLCLISGGGSALLPLARPGVALDEVVRTTELLLRSGATIREMNTVRKHLSAIAGGQLARAVSPARLVTLIVSDVVGTPLDVVASGPTVPDPTTYADALRVLDAYDLASRVPAAVRRTLRRGVRSALPETPKPGDAAFRSAHVVVVADNAAAARAAVSEARRLGFRARLLSTYIEGEARAIGRTLGGVARQMAETGDPIGRPACLVAGGETTVTMRGSGKGGRNQELALAGALSLEDVPHALLVSFATDGGDGPTDAAGGVADGTTLRRARAQGLDPMRHLNDNNAYPLLAAVGDLIRTGPTNTNVADLMLVLCGGPGSAAPRHASAARGRGARGGPLRAPGEQRRP